MADYAQVDIDTYNASRVAAEQALSSRVDIWTGVPDIEPYLARVEYETAEQAARATLEATQPPAR